MEFFTPPPHVMTHLEPSSVACLGPEGSFSHEFASSAFPNVPLDLDSTEFHAVVAKVADGQVDAAVVPFLNSNGIDVRPAQQAIANHRDKVFIV